MAHEKALKDLDVTMRDLRGNDILMGGALLPLWRLSSNSAHHPKVNTGR